VHHRWTQAVVARSVTRAIEISRGAFVAELRRMGIFDAVVTRVHALMFPNACGDPKLLLEAVSGVAQSMTPPTYPVSDSRTISVHEYGFGADPHAENEAPEPERRPGTASALRAVATTTKDAATYEEEIAEAAKRAQRELRQLQRDRMSTRLQLETAATNVHPRFAELLLQDKDRTVATVTHARQAKGHDARQGKQLRARWSKGRALMLASDLDPDS
jgi:putative heme iron utilization protein